MIPFEFTVAGPPLSQQAKDRTRLQSWKNTVRAEAARRWPRGQPAYTGPLFITVVYYHEGVTIRMDNDNMVKPIQDALNGLVYLDDRQNTDTRVRKTPLDGSFRVRGMSAVLAEGFVRGVEFLHVKVEEAPDHAELLR
jgi:Holliday junction resolvase RusA-like endonuclease